jgi:hypothetical protein
MSRNEKMFSTLESANAFADALPESFDAVSVLTNTPTVGKFMVRWGTESDNMDMWTMFGNAIKREDAAAREAEDVARSGEATQQIARAVAGERGLTGRDAEMFVFGFTKWSAKTVDPRAEGCANVFRAGRKAAAEPEISRRIRARIASLRAAEG